MKVLAAIIAGGSGRRFGSDKAQAILDGRTLLDHAIAGLAIQCDSLVVCGRSVPGENCLVDRPRPGLGPLGGLAAALHYGRGHGFDAVLTSACDTPRVPLDLLDRLSGEPSVVVGQPLFGYWPVELSDELDEFLDQSMSKAVRDWVLWTGARRVYLDATIPNINTVDDLATLRVNPWARHEGAHIAELSILK